MFFIWKEEKTLVIFSEDDVINNVEILDLQGRVITSKQGNHQNNIELNIQHVPKGIYIVKSETDAMKISIR